MKLIKLLNGDRVRAEFITSIRLGDEEKCNVDNPMESTIPPRVIVDIGADNGAWARSIHNCIVINFTNNEERDKYADWLAAEVDSTYLDGK